jgi:hypothetical protein
MIKIQRDKLILDDDILLLNFLHLSPRKLEIAEHGARLPKREKKVN